MIRSLRGRVLEKSDGRITVETGGVGYEVHASERTLRAAGAGGPVFLWIEESTSPYGQAVLYGFSTEEERDLFRLLRDHLPKTGSKKALDYLNRIGRSLDTFRRAVMTGDESHLCRLFRFRRNTARKLIAALQEKIGRIPSGSGPGPRIEPAAEGLIALGFSEQEALVAASEAAARLPEEAETEEILREALKRLARR